MRRFNTFCLVLICAAIFTFPVNLLFAQEKHEHEAPHGGMVITVGKYHYEMVVDDTMKAVYIYLLDKKEKTLPVKDITGKATFLFPDKTKEKADLVVDEDHFKADLDSTKLNEFTVAIVLKIDGKSQIGRFKYKAGMVEDHHEEKGHHEKKEHHDKEKSHHKKEDHKG